MSTNLHLINNAFTTNANGSLNRLGTSFAPGTWDYYVLNCQTDGVQTAVTIPQPGNRITYTLGSSTVYRFISTATTGLYPSVDAFYSDQALTAQLVQRGA